MAVWRIQKRTDTDVDVAKYCLDNRVLAMGWSMKDSHLEEVLPLDILDHAKNKRSSIKSYSDYAEYLKEFNVYGGRVNSNVRRFVEDVCADDLVWMRREGVYYLGRVTEESQWHYNASAEALNADASNQIDNIEWLEVGDESCVPGAIATSMIRGQTLRHINKVSMPEYSKLLYNSLTKTNHYSVDLHYGMKTFYNLFSTEDCEDLLCMWLYRKYGYVCVPSTNKKSTELYECVLLDPKTGKHIFPQAKAGKVDLYVSAYEHLVGECWLFTTGGNIIGNETQNVRFADPKELFSFVEDDSNRTILPDGILHWYDFMKTYR